MRDDEYTDSVIINIRSLGQLKDCYKKTSHSSICSSLGRYRVKLESKSNGLMKYEYRCEKHKNTATSNFKVVEIKYIEDLQYQYNLLDKINDNLQLLVGYEIRSHFHRPCRKEKENIYYLNVIYVHKEKRKVLMCQTYTKKWVAVYYEQLALSTEKLGINKYADITTRKVLS